MCCEKIREREAQILHKIFRGFKAIPGIKILADNAEERIGAVSFYLENVHFNLVVRLLNDHFGIQVRGGCSCAGTYGHYLLHVDYNTSCKITSKIDQGDLSEKPGWVRLSVHPTMTDAEVDYIIESVASVAENAGKWGEDYYYDPHLNDYIHKTFPRKSPEDYRCWFNMD